ncbi:MAG: hypothetical protein ACOC2W_03125, partial [bacterium]
MKQYKPTLDDPVNSQSQNFEKGFDKTMRIKGVNLSEDELLTEKEQSLKKKIFSLPKMEALVFADPKLTAVYNEMAEDGEEKYGYHYNETIMNIIFNEYVLNSSEYLQKYKNAIPKKKKRRDKSGINTLKKTYGGKDMKQKVKDDKKDVDETTSAGGGAGGAGGSVGAYETPYAWAKNGNAKMRKPIWTGGAIVAESNYLTDPSGFQKLYESFDNSNDNLQAVENQAKEMSKKEGVAVHVNKVGDNYELSDWYDDENTVSSFENGNKLNESNDMKQINEKAKSQQQQKFMGMVHAYKKGELKDSEVSDEV